MSDLTPVDANRNLTSSETNISNPLVQIETGRGKLENILERNDLTVEEYLDNDSHQFDRTLGDLDRDILMYLLDRYFRPVNREERSGFPAIPEGHVRLFRGEQPRNEDEDTVTFEGQGRWWTQFLDIASDYAEGEGRIYYTDVPEAVAQRNIISRVHENLDRPVGGPDAFIFEFYIPSEYVEGGQGTQNVLDSLVTRSLLEQGEFTRFGVYLDTSAEFEDLSDEQKELWQVRISLIDLAAEATLAFWDADKYENDPKFREEHPDAENYQKPKYPDTPESAEHLLAKISGWK